MYPTSYDIDEDDEEDEDDPLIWSAGEESIRSIHTSKF
jgi:hypothetical protein